MERGIKNLRAVKKGNVLRRRLVKIKALQRRGSHGQDLQSDLEQSEKLRLAEIRRQSIS